MSNRDSQKFYWLKTDKDHYNTYKIRSLMSEKKGDTYLVIYEQLCCEGLNYGGELRYSENRAYTTSELAFVINRPVALLEETLKVLEQKELIKVKEDGTIIIFDLSDRVGYVSGQTLRKKRSENGNGVVNFTNDLPNETVIPTPEIRDKRLDIRNDDDEINIMRVREEAGWDIKNLLETQNAMKKLNIPINDYNFNVAYDVMAEKNNPIGYLATMMKNGDFK